MTSVLRSFSALSKARPPLLSSCSKAPTHSVCNTLHASFRNTRIAGYSSIADAMLNRAVQSYQPPPQKKENLAVLKAAATRQASSQSSSPPVAKGIDDLLKNGARNGTKSISGWTNSSAVNANSSSLLASTAGPGSRTNTSYSRPSTASVTMASNGRKRTSSEINGLAAALGSQDSFEDNVRSWNSVSTTLGSRSLQTASKPAEAIDLEAEVIDLTQGEEPSKSHVPQPAQFDFDPDDFEDDDELDLEMEYPLSLPAITQMLPPKPPGPTYQQLPIPSSAQTWSSSPLAHKLTPPRAAIASEIIQQEELQLPLVSSEPSIDANPRPAKRRTTPWAQRKAEEREKQLQQDEEEASGGVQCYRCKEYGHMVADCPKSRSKAPANGHEDGFTPLPKDKTLPWNTTASAIKDQQKAFKNHQKMVKEKQEKLSMDELFMATKSAQGKEPTSSMLPTFLSDEQQSVLDLVTQKKKSVFFTGSAGTGKSVLMRSIIAKLRQMHQKEPDRVAVTASTGLAACNIGGVTLHSFSGIGLGKESVKDLVKKIMRNPKAKNRWLRTKVLVIDEVSMVDGELFDKLEGIARLMKKNARPFGGIQLVVTGDFFQLPPVPDYGKREVKFAFDADTWSTSINHTIGLTQVFRQRDPVFANMLNEMRLGKISDATVKAFRRLDRPLENSAYDATELFPTRNEVENSNFMKMRQLQGESKIYMADDGGTVKDPQQLERLLQNFMAPKKLELKVGAQVMLIKNMDDGLVNGSLGKVVRFMSEGMFEKYVAGEIEIPQDKAGMEEVDAMSAEIKKRLNAMGHKGPIADTGIRYPVVRFLLPDGMERELLCQPEDWKIELPNGEVQAQRRQIPLILAWALSIHKAQGQTLERVKVDLRRIFENGQAYVALSRATTQEGLWVQNFNAKAVMAHPRVGEFYQSLYSVNKALMHPKVKAPERAMKENKADVMSRSAAPRKVVNDDWDEDEEAMMAAYG